MLDGTQFRNVCEVLIILSQPKELNHVERDDRLACEPYSSGKDPQFGIIYASNFRVELSKKPSETTN
jgi:hypothetical protein